MSQVGREPKVVEPYPKGTRVHHTGAIYSLGRPDDGENRLNGGWGRVLRAVKQRDNTYEYEVEQERTFGGRLISLIPGRSRTTWWGSHHIDEALDHNEKEAASSCPGKGSDD
jgi:hypothetical protein